MMQKKKHMKNKQSQHSNRSSKSGDMFSNTHNAKNKSVDYSQDHKDAIVDLMDNDNDNDDFNDDNNDDNNEK